VAQTARTPPLPHLAGVILCGGRSRRMGTDKALMTIDGERLVDRAARRLATVADPLILARGARRLDVAGCIAVDDAVPGAGPLGGVVAGLRRSPHQLAAIVAVDMPWFDPELLACLAAGWGGEDAAVPVTDRGLEPLHAVYARSALPLLEDALAGESLRMLDALDRLAVRRVEVRLLASGEAGMLFATNLNTPDDALTFRSRREGA
jgi:molybdopterin-guanine dinucleotide biosynthesis protein A